MIKKTTTDKYLESLDSKGKKRFARELKRQVLSEMALAEQCGDMIAVKKLAQLAGVLRQKSD